LRARALQKQRRQTLERTKQSKRKPRAVRQQAAALLLRFTYAQLTSLGTQRFVTLTALHSVDGFWAAAGVETVCRISSVRACCVWRAAPAEECVQAPALPARIQTSPSISRSTSLQQLPTFAEHTRSANPPRSFSHRQLWNPVP